jgi:hypothetical protein
MRTHIDLSSRRALAVTGAILAVLAIAVAGIPALAGAAVPSPVVTGPIPAHAPLGDPSHDYPQYVQDVDYASRGYVEEEYFFEGTATRYSTPAQATGSVISTGHHYKSRLIVRRPTSAKLFNGTVIVEWVNVTSGYNNDALWKASTEHLMRQGYAYVGVSAQQVGIHGPAGLLAWNPTRYAGLDLTAAGTVPSDSLSYDVFSQAGQAVRHPNGVDFMAGLPVQRVIASGVSQSQGRLVLYYNSIHPIAQVFDSFYLFLGLGTKLRTDIPTKVMKVNTENDVMLLGEAAARQPDSDVLHTWEVAGTSHVSFIGFPTRQEITRRDGLPVPDSSGCNRPALSRVPTFKVLNAAWEHLVDWMIDGTPPPTSPRLDLVSTSPAVAHRDSFGNILGGIRLAEHAVAIAVNDGVNSGPGFCILYGSHIDFDVATLAQLYSKHSTYTTAVNQVTKDNQRDGFILAEDVQSTRDQADRSIIGTGNPCGPVCRSSQTFRVLTDGAFIPNDDQLLKDIDDATAAIASGDGQTVAKKKPGEYQKALRALQKYISDLEQLHGKGQVPTTVFHDLVDGATALMSAVEDLIDG